MRFSPLISPLQQSMLSYKTLAVGAPFEHHFARCKIHDSSSGGSPGSSRRDGSNLLQGLGSVGAAVLGTLGVDALKTRRISSTGASSYNASSGVGRAVCPIGAVGTQDEEEIGVGDFCPLYSDLPSVSFSPSLAAGPRRLRRSRRREARGAATSENGILIDAAQTYSTEEVLPRVGKVSRVTKETSVDVHINLDGTGICSCNTGVPFLDHMLDQLASHGLLDVKVMAKGDIHIDDHHTNEDVGLAVGTALLQALGNRKGIFRFGDFSAPLDEALVHVVLDLSGRPYLGYDVNIPTQRVGTYDTQLVEHFFQSVVNTSGMTLHIRQLAGRNSHHIIEATFKAFARALRQAIEYDVRRKGTVPSSKGVLSRA